MRKLMTGALNPDWNKIAKSNRRYDFYLLDSYELDNMFKITIKEKIPNNVLKSLWIIENLHGNFTSYHDDIKMITTFYFDEPLNDADTVLFKLSTSE